MESERGQPSPVVCVVDDDESVRRALSRLIGSLGMRTELFASPEEFLARASIDRVDCLLLDVQLPGMDGFELRDRAVKAGLDSPVIFITGHADIRTRERAARAEAVAFLEKPFTDRALLDALTTAIERSGPDREGSGRR